MSRKEFISTLALGFVTIMGFSSIVQLLTGHSLNKNLGNVSSGYGSSVYGGGKD